MELFIVISILKIRNMALVLYLEDNENSQGFPKKNFDVSG